MKKNSKLAALLIGGALATGTVFQACAGNQVKTEKTAEQKCGTGKCGSEKTTDKDPAAKCGASKCGSEKSN